MNCLYCGKEIREEATKCEKCGWEIMPMVSVSELEYEVVSTSAVEVHEQKNILKSVYLTVTETQIIIGMLTLER